MRNMKKVLLMILGAIVCINIYAADNDVQQRRNVRKAPAKTARLQVLLMTISCHFMELHSICHIVILRRH